MPQNADLRQSPKLQWSKHEKLIVSTQALPFFSASIFWWTLQCALHVLVLQGFSLSTLSTSFPNANSGRVSGFRKVTQAALGVWDRAVPVLTGSCGTQGPGKQHSPCPHWWPQAPSTAGSWGQGVGTQLSSCYKTAYRGPKCGQAWEEKPLCKALYFCIFVFLPLKYLLWKQRIHYTPRGQRRLHTFRRAHNGIVLWIIQAGEKVTLLRKSNNHHITHLLVFVSHTCANSSPSWVPVQFLRPWHQFPQWKLRLTLWEKEQTLLKKSSFIHQH